MVGSAAEVKKKNLFFYRWSFQPPMAIDKFFFLTVDDHTNHRWPFLLPTIEFYYVRLEFQPHLTESATTMAAVRGGVGGFFFFFWDIIWVVLIIIYPCNRTTQIKWTRKVMLEPWLNNPLCGCVFVGACVCFLHRFNWGLCKAHFQILYGLD